MKNASLLMKLGTNVDWAIASVITFHVTMATGDSSKLPKNHYFALFFCCFFSSKLFSKCCNFSMD
jgi:hypothetical protein